MAAKIIKGLTVEIGGDTTKLGKALEQVNKQSVALSGELKEVNKLLKMDPSNTDLLAQKQKILADSINNTKKKLDTLKKAEQQVQQQFQRGEVSEAQVRALQREIIETTNRLKREEKQAAETTADLNRFSKASGKAASETQGVGKESKNASKNLSDLSGSADKASKAGGGMSAAFTGAAAGLAAVAAAAAAAIGALVGAAESSREYRTEMGKLTTAFETAGHSAESATQTYKSLQGILGETDQAVEAANHMAKLVDNEKDLATWTNIATGVYATFGASLPIENLTEAANETAKTGAITGGLADALNWAGVSEEQFQTQLDACTTEQERQALITETLNGLYSEAADKYREVNGEVIRANEANEAWASTVADVGAAVEPVLSDVKLLGASLLSELVPGITQAIEGFRGLINGEDGAADAVGEALSGIATQIWQKITELLPAVVEAALSLLTSLVTSLSTMTPLVLEAAVALLMTILDAVPTIATQLVASLGPLVTSIIDTLLTAIPQLLQGALTFLLAIVDAVPLMLQQLLPYIPKIVTTVVHGLLDLVPQLIDAAFTLFFAIVDAVPRICVELIKVLPQIWVAMWSILKSLPARIWNLLQQLIGKWTTFNSTLVTKAGQGAAKIVSALLGVLTFIPSKVWNAIKGAVDKIATWGKNMAAKGRQAATDLFNSIVNKVKELPGKMTSIGSDLVKGLWNGIKNMTSWVKSKISGFSDSVLSGIKNFFGVHSPSTETAWMGEMLAQGLAKGITDNAGLPLDAMSSLADDMLAQENMLNGLTLDRKLNTTFSADSAAATSRPSLMDKLDRILGAIERGQVIMLDGEALVGSTLNSYDNKLGQRRALATRGAL